MQLTVRTAAKVNLTLDVMGRRKDGFHNIRSVMQSIGLFDHITLTETSSENVTISCNVPEVPCNQRNIASRCAYLFFNTLGKQVDGLHINIEKKIPIQAGLAGGSADGAAVLVGLNEMFHHPFSADELKKIGGNVGADIPFCLHGGTALAEGTGTKLTSLRNIPACSFVLVKPPIGISTAEAYQSVDTSKNIPNGNTDEMIYVIDNLEKIGKNLSNTFEYTLNIQELLDIKIDLAQSKGCVGACMTGSGSTVFGIFPKREKAEICAEAFKKKYNQVFVADSVEYSTYVLG